MNTFFFRYKYIFILLTVVASCASDKSETPKNKAHNVNTTTKCPFTKIIEDIFKVHNKSANSGFFLKDSQGAKLFLNSIANVTIANESETSKDEEIVNDIIASINRIKNNITSSDDDDTSLNEAIILNIPDESKNVTNRSEDQDLPAEDRKQVTKIISGIEEKKDRIKPNNTVHNKEETKIKEDVKETNKNKTKYVEILTIEPNNTNVSNTTSHNIIEVLKHLMPLLNTTQTKELHNITIIETNYNKNQSISTSKNVSTIVVTYCDKENTTKANISYDPKETIDKFTENASEEYDLFMDESDADSDYEGSQDEVNLTTGEKKDILEAAEYGMQKMHELYSVLEPKLYHMGELN